jgi:hypothetical protein
MGHLVDIGVTVHGSSRSSEITRQTLTTHSAWEGTLEVVDRGRADLSQEPFLSTKSMLWIDAQVLILSDRLGKGADARIGQVISHTADELFLK